MEGANEMDPGAEDPDVAAETAGIRVDANSHFVINTLCCAGDAIHRLVALRSSAFYLFTSLILL